MSLVISGAVSVKLQGLLKHKHLPGEWAAIYDGSQNKPPQVALYLEPDSRSPVYVITLEHLKFPDKSYQQSEASFNLSIKKEKHQFQFESLNDRDDWVDSLCFVSTELWMQRASSVQVGDSKSKNSQHCADVMQDNFLYDSCGAVQQFKVSVCPTKASAANQLRGYYLLSPTLHALRLLEIDTSKCIHDWPYKQIRKFGNTRLVFKMEVGRKCSTGEGEFEFFTPDSATVVDSIAKFTKQSQECKPPEENSVSVTEARPPHTGSDFDSYSLPGHETHSLDRKVDGPRQSARPKPTVKHTSSEPPPRIESEYSNVDACQSVLSQPMDKKISEKERKSQEKTAAKLKKQEKAAQEKEAKERKEREKKQKDQRGTSKLTRKTSSGPGSRIYDEPENIRDSTQSSEAVGASVFYSTPQRPQKDSWKKHARPEDFHVHTEDYHNIKSACESQPAPGTRPSPGFGPPFTAGAEDSMYSRLGDFSRQAAGQENIYGMASAKDTLRPSRPPPVSAFAGESEYEEADDIAANLSRQKMARAMENEYEETANPFMGKRAVRQVTPSDGDYADVV